MCDQSAEKEALNIDFLYVLYPPKKLFSSPIMDWISQARLSGLHIYLDKII